MKSCNTEVQVADIFTKALSSQRHAYLRVLLGVCDFQSRGSVGDMIQNLQHKSQQHLPNLVRLLAKNLEVFVFYLFNS